MNERRSALDRDIEMTHERFIQAIGERLPNMGPDTKERYFAVLSMLVAKLEDPEKNLRDIASEMMVEAATLIMEQIQSFDD